MGVVFIWLCCAVVCAIVAYQKGRSVSTWFLAGIIGGFISVIILLLLASKKQTPDKDIL